jgi:hypothetical protein
VYPGKIVTGTAVTSGGALAVTGHNSMWLVIGGLTLILARSGHRPADPETPAGARWLATS